MNMPDTSQPLLIKTKATPETIELVALGNALVEEGKLDEAERLFQQGTLHFPTQVVFYERMAHIATRKDQHEKASMICKHIVDRFPNFSDGYAWYSDALLLEGKFEDAEKHLLFFQDKFPGLPESYERLARIYCEQGNFAHALGYCKVLHRKSPHYASCPSSDANVFLESLFKANFQKALDHGLSVSAFDAQEHVNDRLTDLLVLTLFIDQQEETLKNLGKEPTLIPRNAPIPSINHAIPRAVSIDIVPTVALCLTKILHYYIKASFSSSQQNSYVFEDAPEVPLAKPLIGVVPDKPNTFEARIVCSHKDHMALYDRSGRIIPQSIFFGFRFNDTLAHFPIPLPFFKPPRGKGEMELEQESVLFMWGWGGHYGHWMQQGLTVAWYLCNRPWDGKFMFPKALTHEWQFETLELLNIHRDRIIHPDRPRVLRHVVIPEPGNVLYAYAREQHLEIYRFMARNALRVPAESLSQEAQRALQFDKIYFSRSDRSYVDNNEPAAKIKMRATVGELELEQVLQDNGFYIIHPHNFTETEKIHIINRARVMVFNEASSRYALAYCLHKPKVLVTGHTFSDINLHDQLADYPVKFYRYPIFSTDNADHRGLCVVNIPAFLEMLKSEGLLD
ncbi:glycosyltransferase 61 family protein [Pseudodesulfovibrio indicus]|uniref:glycosyltransferase 61 family protein n=1 Tax=Pseudodesulfovibrio indicus TaxID=1716143 RepID=UPI002930249D|nr:glycosyltransferase 61 family protein [Pseudodesulfovibrio indicus]